jgi:hypothetical protein
MTERIDFALEPGVVIFAALFFVLVNLLLAAVLYPYFRSSSSGDGQEEVSSKASAESAEDLIEEGPSQDEDMEKRVDEFLDEIHGERTSG